MKQNLTELIYLREEEAMNLELSLNMVNAMKRYWKEFKSYSLAKNISYFDNNQIHLYLKDNYNCLLINNTNNLSKKQKEVIKAMLLLIDINNISKYTVITYKDIPLNDYYKEVLNNYLDFWQNIKNNSESPEFCNSPYIKFYSSSYSIRLFLCQVFFCFVLYYVVFCVIMFIEGRDGYVFKSPFFS